MKNKIKYLLRLDEDIKLYTARQARLNDRSLNQEINYRLRLLKLFDDYCATNPHTKMASEHNKLHALSEVLANHSTTANQESFKESDIRPYALFADDNEFNNKRIS